MGSNSDSETRLHNCREQVKFPTGDRRLPRLCLHREGPIFTCHLATLSTPYMYTDFRRLVASRSRITTWIDWPTKALRSIWRSIRIYALPADGKTQISGALWAQSLL